MAKSTELPKFTSPWRNYEKELRQIAHYLYSQGLRYSTFTPQRATDKIRRQPQAYYIARLIISYPGQIKAFIGHIGKRQTKQNYKYN
jgi:hypothetical protein